MKRNMDISFGCDPASSMSLGYPVITVHQLYVSEFVNFPSDGPRNGLLIPRWLYEKAGFKYGEKITLTREACSNRPVDSLKNRTITPVFPTDNDHVAALGPTGKFLGNPGPSCCIAYAYSKNPEKEVTVAISFPAVNTKNRIDDMTINVKKATRYFNYVDDTLYNAMRKVEREVIAVSISGLSVEVGDPYCNPRFAQAPVEIIKRASLPKTGVEAYFCSMSNQQPALRSYLLPSYNEKVSMSGALFGAFPVGVEIVIDIYARTLGDLDVIPTLVHVHS